MLVISTIGFGFIGGPDSGGSPVAGDDPENDPEAALREVEDWLYRTEDDPSEFNYRQLARAYKNAGKLQEALETALKAEEKDQEDVMTHQLLAEIYAALGDGESLTGELRKIVELEPGNADARLQLAGALQYSSDNIQEAIEQYEKVIELQPANLQARAQLAMALQFSSDDLTGAIEQYEKILELQPDNEQVRHMIAMCYIEEEDYEKAEEQYEWLSEKNPEDISVIAGRAEICKKKKDYDGALSLYNKAMELKPEASFLYSEIAEVYHEKKDLDKAVETYNKALAISDDPDLRIKLATIYEEQEKKEEAVKELEAALTMAEERKDEKLKLLIDTKLKALSKEE